MKKLVVLMAAMLVAAGALWAQAAAPAAPSYPQITTAGLVQYMALPDFGAGREYSDQPRIELKWTIKLDDFNSVYIELEEYPEALSTGAGGIGYSTNTRYVPAVGAISSGFAWQAVTSANAGAPVAQPFDKAWFTTDWGKALKLPMGVVTKFGFEEFNNADAIKVTKSEWEDWLGEKDFRKWGMQIEIMPSPMVTLRSSWSWNPREKLFLAGAYGTVAPISYEVTYFTNGYSTGAAPYASDLGTINNWVEAGLKFSKDLSKDLSLGVAGLFEYDLADYVSGATDGTLADGSAATRSVWYAQLGARAVFQKMASLGLSWRGLGEYVAGGLQVEAWAQPIKDKPLEIIAQVGLGLDGDVYDTMFDSLEAVLKYTIGKSSWYIGILYAPELSRMIAKEWVDMNVAPLSGSGPTTTARRELNDTTALFFRGTLAF